MVGAGGHFHAVPFQCSIQVLREMVVVSPTAQAFRAELAATPLRNRMLPG